MLEFRTIDGTYGSYRTPCKVFVYRNWYAVKDSRNVTCSDDDIQDGVNVEKLHCIDNFYNSVPIANIEDLIEVIDRRASEEKDGI